MIHHVSNLSYDICNATTQANIKLLPLIDVYLTIWYRLRSDSKSYSITLSALL